MVKRLPWREFSCLGFIQHLGILSILRRKFLFNFLHCLCKSSGEGEFPDVWMAFPKCLFEPLILFLLSTDCCGVSEVHVLAGS